MNPKIKHSRDRAFKRFVYIFFFLMCACFVLPLIVVISASFTSEQALTSGGFSLLPRDFTLDAYKSAFSSGTRVLRAYGVTIFRLWSARFSAASSQHWQPIRFPEATSASAGPSRSLSSSPCSSAPV